MIPLQHAASAVLINAGRRFYNYGRDRESPLCDGRGLDYCDGRPCMNVWRMTCGLVMLTVGLILACGCMEAERLRVAEAATPQTVVGPATPIGQPAPESLVSPWSYEGMLLSMIDLKDLARPPVPGVTCKQFSSYDRASRIDEKTGRQIGWEANADHGKFLRQEGSAFVMADMAGPGCIVRIWSANPMGILKIYLDGNEKPALEGDFLRLTTGKIEPFAEPIVGRRSEGANIYLPIPYQKHCKVVVDQIKEPQRLYYHVNYWTYKPDTKVPTWSPDLLKQNMDTYKKVCRVLGNPVEGPANLPKAAGKTFTMNPGDKVELNGQPGPGAIRVLKVKATAKALERALREVAISITFDNASKPQVWAPLGDFFGTAPGLNPYPGLPLGMTQDGWMYCYWFMPYRQTATVRFDNEGKQEVSLEVLFGSEALPEFKDLMYFHAGWRRTNPNTVFDWPLLEVTGAGRFVGVAMFVFNPKREWWGEGDEKVWVDGEKFPSWFGTGSEDYFGYAWCCPRPFTHAYHNQPRCDGPGNQNHSSVNRFHIIDNIPFTTSYRMTIENYGKDKDYSCTTYWYAVAGATDFFSPVPVEQRGIAARSAAPRPRKIAGAIEGESLKIIAKNTTGSCDPQDMEGFGPNWSGNSHMWFRPGKAGEWVELELPVAADGKYKLIVYGTKAIDYGIVQYSLNGRTVGSPIDGYNEGVVPTNAIDLGVVDLKKGTAKLKMEVVGKNPKSTGFMAGLDGVVLEAVK